MLYKLIVVIGGADLQIGNYTDNLGNLATASTNVRSGLWAIEGYESDINESLRILSNQLDQNTDNTDLSRLLMNLGLDRINDLVKSNKPFQSTLSSILLGFDWRMSAGGNGFWFTNSTEDINYFAVRSGIKDMNVLANRDPAVGILAPTARTYPVYFEAPLNGLPDPSVIVYNENSALVPDNTSGVAVEFILGENIVPTDTLKYKFWFGSDDSGIQTFEQELTGLTFSTGDTFEWVFSQPIEILAGTTIFARVEKFPNNGAVGTTLLSRAAIDQVSVYFILKGFGFVDSEVALKNEVMGNTLETLISSESTASSQKPSSLDTPIQIEFGASQITTEVELSVLGTLTFKDAGLYYVSIHGQYGAPQGGGEASLRFRLELNGSPYGDVFSATVKDTKTSIPLIADYFIDVEEDDEVKAYLLRDSSENNKGGLYKETTALAGWDDSPSASLSVQRFI